MKNLKSQDSIAIIVSSLAGGGAERVAINLANDFSKRFNGVYLIILVNKIKYQLKINKNVRIINLDSKKTRFSVLPLLKNLNKLKPKYVLSIMRDSSLIVGLCSYFFNFKSKLIFREANTFDDLEKENFLLKNILRIICIFFYTRSKNFIANSIDTKNSLNRFLFINKKLIKVINNPVFSNDFNYQNIEVSNDKWIRDKTLKVIIGMGRLTPQKDFATLIKAFSLVIKTNKNCRLIICGEGDQKQNLLFLIKELNLINYVKIIGFTHNPYAYLKGADIFCLTSLWEGFGNVIVEALGLGTTVISTNCKGGPKEIIINKKIGKLVPVQDYIYLAKEIIEEINNPSDNKSNIRYAVRYKSLKVCKTYFKFITSSK